MTISFSGLASGLDTSSWVESLVALKQAKVESLEAEKENVLLSKETLDSIKSFFNSFRSVIEKVTDAKYGSIEADIFAQNLAVSSNLDVLTATATHEAEESTYEILVDKLATETKANSNYTYITTYTQTTIATYDSKLTDLGADIDSDGDMDFIQTGTIRINVDGVEHSIEIEEDDTIATFIEKLKEIGVEASYDIFKGTFTMNIDSSDITDVDGTRIFEVLHLADVNEGYLSSALEVEHAVYKTAGADTKLSELYIGESGETFSAGTIHVEANGVTSSIELGANETIESFIAKLTNINVSASYDELTGILTIEDATITDTDGTNILKVLGLDIDVYSKSQSSNLLSQATTTTATAATKLVDIGSGYTISGTKQIVLTNSNDETTTVNVTSNTTINDLLVAMTNHGMSAEINSDGSIEISGGTITGANIATNSAGETVGITDILGLEEEPYSAMVSGNSLTETITVPELVTLETTFDELGVKAGYMAVVIPDSGDIYYQYISGGMTINDLMVDMANLGIDSDFDSENAVLTFTGGGFATLTDADVQARVADNSIQNPITQTGTDLIESLFGAATISAEQTEVAGTYARTRALTYNVVNEYEATLSTTLGQVSLTAEGTAVFDVRGELRTINVSKSDTLQGLMDKLAAVGIASSWDSDNQRITIENATIKDTGTSDLYDVLNMETTISGKYVTSSVLNAKTTVTIDATLTTPLSDYGITNSMSTADRTVNLYDANGSLIASTTVVASTEIGDLIDFINTKGASAGISASLVNGVFSVDSGYIENATLEETMGLDTSNSSSYVLGSIMTYITVTDVTGETTLGNIFDTLGTADKVSSGYNLYFNDNAISVSENTTLNQLIDLIEDAGGNAYLDSTGRLAINGGTVRGTVAEALGITTITNISSVSAAGEILLTKEKVYATKDTQLSDLGVTANISFTVHDHLGSVIATETLTKDATIGEFFDLLKKNTYNIDAIIADGVISMESAEGKYITGALATHLGIGTQTVAEVINTTSKSITSVYYTDTLVATDASVISEFVNIGNGTITVSNGDGELGKITITSETTFGSMFASLASYGITGSIENGKINLVSDDGTYATGEPMTALGIGIQTTTYAVTTGAHSSSAITYTQTEYATLDSLLKDFSLSGKTITLTKPDGTAIANMTTTDTTTFDDVFEWLKDNGVEATIKDGVVSFETTKDINISGTLISSLGMIASTETITTTIGLSQSGTKVTNNITEIADEESVIKDFGLTGTLDVKNSSGTPQGSLIIGETSTNTFADMIEFLDNYGIVASINNGTVSLVSTNGNFVDGTLATALGFSTVANGTTTAGTSKTGTQITYSKLQTADEESLMTKYITAGNLTVHSSTGTALGTLAVGDTTTFANMIEFLDGYGIVASINDGVVSLVSTEGNYVGGAVAGSLGFGTATVTTVTTTGKTVSGGAVTYNKTCTLTASDTLGKILTSYDFAIYKTTNSSSSTFSTTLTAGTSFANFFALLSDYGIDADIDNGKITINTTGDYYVKGGLITALGIGPTTTTVTKNVAIGRVEGSAVTYTVTKVATLDDKITDSVADSTYSLEIKNADGDTIYSFGGSYAPGDNTWADLFNALSTYGIAASMSDGYITISSACGNYITGTFAEALGIGTNTFTKTISVGTTSTSSNAITYTKTAAATMDTTLAELGVTSYNLGINHYKYIDAENGWQLNRHDITLNSSTTIAGLFDALAAGGVAAVLNSDGSISVNGAKDGGDENYARDYSLVARVGLAIDLGIGGDGVVTSITITTTVQTSITGSSVSYNKTVTAIGEQTSSKFVNIGGVMPFANVTLGELNLSPISYTVLVQGSSRTGTFGTSTSIITMVDTLNSYGLSANYDQDSGLFVVTCTDEVLISGCDSNDFFNAHGGLTTLYNISMSEDTIIGDLTDGDELAFGITHADGTQTTVRGGATDTLGQVLSDLNAAGIKISVSGSAISINGGTEAYIHYVNRAAALGLPANHTDYYTSTTSTTIGVASNKTSPGHTVTTTHTMTSDTLLSDLGYTNQIALRVRNKDGIIGTIQAATTATVGDVMSSAASFGINIVFTNSGKLSMRYVDDVCLSTISPYSDLTNLGLSITTTTKTESTVVNNLSNKFTKNVTQTLNEGTTLGELGLTGTDYQIGVSSGGPTVNSSTTVGDIIAYLAAYDIVVTLDNDGSLAIAQQNAENYISDPNADVFAALGLSTTATDYYTTRTTNTYANHTASSTKTYATTLKMTTNTTLGELGITTPDSCISIYNSNGSYAGSITANAASTVGDIAAGLAAFDFLLNISNDDGKVQLRSNNDYYIFDGFNLLNAMGLSPTATDYYTQTTTKTFSNTTDNKKHTYTQTSIVADGTTTFAELGKAGGYSFTVNYIGQDYTVNVNGNNTINDLLTTLAGFGISGEIVNGTLTLEGTKDGYIKTVSGDIMGALNMSTTVSEYYSETNHYKNSSDDTLHDREITITMSSDKTFAEIGQLSTADGTMTVVYLGKQYTVSVNKNNTLDDLLTQLAGFGISGKITDGIITLTGTDDGYITAISTSLNFLGLTAGQGNTWTTYTNKEYSFTDSNVQSRNVTYTMQTDTTFKELDSTFTGGSISGITYEGETFTVNVEANDTIDDLISTLAGYGFASYVTNGVLDINGTGDCKITSISDLLKNKTVKLTDDTINVTDTKNDVSNLIDKFHNDLLITGDTVLSSIADLTGGNLIVHQTNGQFVTISIDNSNTLDEFFAQIADYGLIGSVDTDGKVTITGVGNVYLKSVDGGSNILSKLNMSNVVEKYQTVTVNRTSDVLNHTVTVEATGTTTLGNLIHSDGNGPAGYNMTLKYTSDAGNNTVNLTFTSGSTLHDVIDKLREYGLNASIDSAGRFSVDSYLLDDFDLTGALATFLMGTYSKEYGSDTTYNKSSILKQKIVVEMTDETLLSEFGINSGNIEIVQDGVGYTVNFTGTTVGDFRNLLAQYGFDSFIDDKGRLSISHVGESYLKEVAGGSNILDILGITDWTVGISQESDHLYDTLDDEHRIIKMSDKLSILKDEAGNNLNITNGSIYVYQDGTRYAVSINTNDTLQDLANKLAQYGITMGISEATGRLYFDGDNDSYMTTDGIAAASKSNILDKFKIEGNWSTRYDSTSENLTYTQTDNEEVTGTTKVTELRDSAGNDLGVTEGAYNIYFNGVRYTETITEDTTVDDFKATLATYGLIADFDENGELAVSSYGNTYLETSAYGLVDNSNIVDALFTDPWEFINVYTSNNLDIPTPVIQAVTRDTKLADINETDDHGNTYQAGKITVIKDGVQTDITLTADDTLGTLIDELAMYGFDAVINDNGQLIIKNTGDSKLQVYSGTGASNILQILGAEIDDWITTNHYDGDALVDKNTSDISITLDTKLNDITGFDLTTGEYYIFSNGVKYTAMISSDETVGSFIETLKSFGLDASLVNNNNGTGAVLKILGNGDSYIEAKTGGTNILELFNPVVEMQKYEGDQEVEVIEFINAELDTLLSYYDEGTKKAEGSLHLNINGKNNIINITSNETFGSLIKKIEALGLIASMVDGKLLIESAYDELSIDFSAGTSKINETVGLSFQNDIGGYVATEGDKVEQTITISEQVTLSAAHYAGMNTQLSTLNIVDGTLSVYRNGEKALINIVATDTFADLDSRISAAFGDDVKLTFENGYLKFYSDDPNIKVEVGATTDSGNFARITGITNDGSGVVKSARELYSVNLDSVITNTGLFRAGNVTEGFFIVGDEQFEIKAPGANPATDPGTTIRDIISQINASEKSGATAYWDSIDGKIVLKARNTGATYINVQAGSLDGTGKASNFTDILGLTNCDWNNEATGNLRVSRMNAETQEIGDNARISINGTYLTSTSNNIGSDVSRLKGVTINLKGMSEGEKVTLTVEKDKETIANVLSDTVDAYNELMKNVDEAIKLGGQLHSESTLKMLRNEIKSLMTSSILGTNTYKNLSQIGISTSSASVGSISTSHESIVALSFDKDKFLKAFDADQEAVKILLRGDGASIKGIFTELENLLYNNTVLTSGYFSTAEKSYSKQINRIDDKIKKQNKAVERYRARLEAKFASMDLLIAQMQQQYSSFLVS